MDGFAISIGGKNGERRYRHDGTEQWDLGEGIELAEELLGRNSTANHVTVGNREHEFRLLRDNEGDRHADWYVDVRFNKQSQRWRYRPLADLDNYEAADELAGRAADDLPDITCVWVGCTDGTEFEADLAQH